MLRLVGSTCWDAQVSASWEHKLLLAGSINFAQKEVCQDLSTCDVNLKISTREVQW